MPDPLHLLLTGATGGLGQALATAYAGPGVHLSLTGRDPVRLAAVSFLCRGLGAIVDTALLDIRDGAALRAWILARDAALPVTTGIACAGVSHAIGKGGAPEPIEAVRRVFAVNALAAVETASALAERMRARRRGHIGIVSSLGGWHGTPSSPSYSASKSAARIYGEALRGWLAPSGVTVTVICPGFVDSPMSRRYLGAKPLTWEASRAAVAIRHSVEAGAPRLNFPWPLALGNALLWLLPARLTDAILRRYFAFAVRPDAESLAEEREKGT
jgi:short-subunit dehydrogenase